VRQVDFRIVQHVMRPLLVKNDIAATTMMHVAAHEQVYQRLKSEVFSKYAPHDADSRMPYEEDIVVLRRAVYLLSAWGHSEDPDAHCAKIDALIQEHVDSIRRLYPESFSVHNSAPPTGMIARLQLSQLMEYMRERFHGNEESYYDSRNSYLLSVLQRGLGIPISLAMLMIVLGHSLGMSEFIMLNSPGHFLMRYTNPHVQDCDFIVDAFRGILVEIPPEGQEAALSILPCKSRKAFVRMISNLVNTFAPADGSGFLMPSDLPASMESYVDSWREVDMREKFVSLLRLAILAVPKPARPYFVSEALKSLEMLKLAIEYRETMSEHVPPRESAAHYNSINLISKWLSLPTVSRWMAKVRDIASAHGLADVWSDVVRPSIFTGAPLDEVNVHV
jgi:regulator of sirC expression with transglutaminase-like and TPR domain